MATSIALAIRNPLLNLLCFAVNKSPRFIVIYFLTHALKSEKTGL